MGKAKYIFLFFAILSMYSSLESAILPPLPPEKIEEYHGQQAICFSSFFKKIPPDYLYQLLEEHPERAQELNDYFCVSKKYHKKKGSHKKVISYSLFWKAPNLSASNPEVNCRTVFQDTYPEDIGRSRPRNFFGRYVAPMIRAIECASQIYPDWVVRIYLARDLKFLAKQYFLKFKNVEVYLMKSSSVRASPGAMWRFLAFDDPKVDAVIIKDSDELLNNGIENDIRSWINRSDTTGFYRANDPCNSAKDLSYSPIVCNNIGGKKMRAYIRMEAAMKGFILHRILFADEPRHPDDICGKNYPYKGSPEIDHPYGFGNLFPVYGFDERFMKHVVYFHMADLGLLSTIPTDDFISNPASLSVRILALSDYIYIGCRKKYSQTR